MDSKPVYNKEFLETNIKSHGNELTDFYNKEILKVDSNHTFLAVISLDSALKKDENWYMQSFLKECKNIKVKLIGHIINDLESSSDDSHEESIQGMGLMFFENFLFEEANLKMSNVTNFTKCCNFKCLIWGSNFLSLFWEQFWKGILSNKQCFIIWDSNFENVFFEGAVLKMYWKNKNENLKKKKKWKFEKKNSKNFFWKNFDKYLY